MILNSLLKTDKSPTQAMLPALEAILGHRSAHSLATGPVMAEPTGTQEKNKFSQFYPALKREGQHTGAVRSTDTLITAVTRYM